MRLASLSVVFLFMGAGCQFDGSGVGPRPGQPADASLPPGGDAAVPGGDAAVPGGDAALLDAPSGADAALLDAGGGVDAPAWPCLDDVNYVARQGNSHRYRAVTAAASWQAARQACEADGAYLVVIDDNGENGHLATVGTGDRWIGLSDEATEGDFAWVTGAPSDYRNWKGGSPNNSDTNDCVRTKGSGQWEVRSCSETNAYVCECDPDWAP